MLTVRIKTDNAAFDPDPAPELFRLLKVAAWQIQEGARSGPLYDTNGNAVGSFRLTGSRRRAKP